MTAVAEPDTEKPYVGPVFTYQPENGGDPIIFPSADVLWEDVDGVKPAVFLWRIRKLNEPYQTFAFLDRAKVPDEMAERVLDLPAEERSVFFRRWFDEVEDHPDVDSLPPES